MLALRKIDLQFRDLKTHVGRSNCLFNLEGIYILYNMHLLIVNSYFQRLLVCDATSVVINERKQEKTFQHKKSIAQNG